MALLAFGVDVRALQFERCEIVIKLGGLPAGAGVTRATVSAEAADVRFVFAMTGVAIGRGFLEISDSPRIGVTLSADGVRMFAGYLKCNRVCKVFPETIHAIMTIQTGVAVSK